VARRASHRAKDPTQRRCNWTSLLLTPLYMDRVVEHGWSRNVLVMQIESHAMERAGRAVTNFEARLPRPQSDLARETLKDPYRFDFLGLTTDAQVRQVEDALTHHITRFLLELGAGFAFVGRQVHMEVGGQDFYADLLFYHLKLRCYVVGELKTGAFEPEHAGKLNFYLSAVDTIMKTEQDAPSIGLLLCKTRNKVVAEYALRGMEKPIGVAEYQLVHALPLGWSNSCPPSTRSRLSSRTRRMTRRDPIPPRAVPPSSGAPAPATSAPSSSTSKQAPSRRRVPRCPGGSSRTDTLAKRDGFNKNITYNITST